MRGFRYFLVVLVAVAGLSLAARLVYSRNAALTESVVAPAPVLAAPAAVIDTTKPGTSATSVDDGPGVARAAHGERAPAALRRRSTDRGQFRESGATTSPTPDPQALVDSTSHRKPEPVIAPLAAENPHPVVATVWQATPRQLVRDSAYVMTNSGRLQAAIAVLDGWVRDHPTDSAVALDLARLRARSGDWAGSITQYNALIEQHRTAQLLFERGQAYLWSGDTRRGEGDLLASEALSPRVETERQLGDHYRWQGDFARSASWYRLALHGAPGDTGVRNAMRLLDRAIDARLLLPGELSGSDFGSGMQAVSDNAGFDLYSLRLSQAFGLTPASGSVLTLSGELRSATRQFGGSESQLEAFGADLFLASRVGSSKVTASLGVLDHGNLSPIVRGSLTADGFLANARLKASVRRAPAYETLWAPQMLGATGSPSTTLATQASLSLPFGTGGELYAMGELLSVSDDNSRTAFQVTLRRRMPASLSLLYTGSLMAYDRQTALYYSPARYLSQSLGLELARYREQGLSYALRAMPGYAWMREPAGTADSTTQDVSAFQFASGFELGYRRGAWDLLLSTGLSSGREGGYRSQNALLFLRRAW